MIILLILNLEQSEKPRGVEIKALLGDTEWEQLAGDLDELCVFATKKITEPSSVILTGARNSAAKYLLFPVKLRRQFKTDEFDFAQVKCGAVKYREKLFVIYEVAKRGFSAPTASSQHDNIM